MQARGLVPLSITGVLNMEDLAIPRNLLFYPLAGGAGAGKTLYADHIIEGAARCRTSFDLVFRFFCSSCSLFFFYSHV